MFEFLLTRPLGAGDLKKPVRVGTAQVGSSVGLNTIRPRRLRFKGSQWSAGRWPQFRRVFPVTNVMSPAALATNDEFFVECFVRPAIQAMSLHGRSKP